jgi:acetylornithine deacetylase
MDPVPLLQELIAHDTHNPAGDEPKLAAFLERELARRGPDRLERVRVPRPDGDARPGEGAYVLASWGEPRVVVNAHLDTVPPNLGWTGDPHVPRVEGGRVIGLGAADTKGAIAAILCALDDARPRDLAVLFSGDEEMGGTCLREFLASGRRGAIERAVVCEPTGCRAGVRHRGVIALVAEFVGAGGHSSSADHMPAPIAELARVAVAWDDWGRARRDEGPDGFQGMCMNVAKLDGGVAFNVVPDRASLSACVRPPPGTDAQRAVDELIAEARRVARAVSVRTVLFNPSFQTRALEDFRGWLGDACDAPIDLAFWTEAAALSQAGIDCVVYGPGAIVQAHAPDEWVPIDDLRRARATFAHMFRATALAAREAR